MASFRAKPPKGALLNRGDKLARGLVNAWLLNESGGLKAYDAVSKSNLTLTSSPTWGSGVVGPNLTFSGSNYCTSGSGQALLNFPLSVVAVLRGTAAPSVNGNFFEHNTAPSSNDGFRIARNASSQLEFTLGGTAAYPFTALTFTNNVWYVVAVTATAMGGTATGYMIPLGGSTLLSGTNTIGSRNGTPNSLSIGAPTVLTTAGFIGQIAGVFTYNRVLSAANIRDFSADPFRMFRRRSLPVPLKPSTGNRRRRVICGASA